jgi:hypothetical protein
VPLNDWNDYDSASAYTFPYQHPRSCSPASFPLNGLIVIDRTAFHIDTTLLGELLHIYLVLVSSLPSLLLIPLPSPRSLYLSSPSLQLPLGLYSSHVHVPCCIRYHPMHSILTSCPAHLLVMVRRRRGSLTQRPNRSYQDTIHELLRRLQAHEFCRR